MSSDRVTAKDELLRIAAYFRRLGDLWEGPDGVGTRGTDLCQRIAQDAYSLAHERMALGLTTIPPIAAVHPVARADSAVPSSHVSGTDFGEPPARFIGYAMPEQVWPSDVQRLGSVIPHIFAEWQPGRVLVFACDPERWRAWERVNLGATVAERSGLTDRSETDHPKAGCGYPYCGGNSPECRHCAEPKASKESIMRKALARCEQAISYALPVAEEEWPYHDGGVRTIATVAIEQMREAMEAARSALAGTPPKDSGDESGAHLGAVQRPGGGTE